MEIFSNIAPQFLEIFKIFGIFFINGGWVVFALAAIYLLWKSYLHEIQHQFVHSQEWIFLSIKVPKENLVSTLAVESIFTQMHALHAAKTFPDKYVEGQIQLWYSLEIVSLGGKVSFILRVPKKTKELVEAAFYSQYQQAEIAECEDYLKNFTYNPENPGDYEIWGTEWKLVESDVVPLKTYKDFEHPAAEETVIDPLSNFFESMGKMNPHELFATQILIQPLGDDEWKPKGEAKIKDLIGEEHAHEPSYSGALMAPISKFSQFSLKNSLLGGGHGHGHGAEENKPKNNWMSMTEAEKDRVSLIERKISKPGYKTKIRFLYAAHKDKFDANKKSLVIGSYRPLGSSMTNKLKPDGNTWTGVDYKFSKTLEQAYLQKKLNKKKRYLIKGFKERETHIGSPMFVLNVEEIATLYHFPITTKTSTVPTAIEKTNSRRSQAPPNLPIAEF
jgi:hypothetical protein